MRQIRGVKGEGRSKLLRALDNKEDGVSSAFPQGKQNEDLIQKFITHVYTDYNMLTWSYVMIWNIKQ